MVTSFYSVTKMPEVFEMFCHASGGCRLHGTLAASEAWGPRAATAQRGRERIQ